MATGLNRNLTIIGIESESTAGTYVAPSAATSYFQPLSDGFELNGSKDKIDRNILTSSIGKATPRIGMQSCAASMPVEFRGSGIEGGDVDFSLLLEGALGTKRSIASTTTTKNAGNTGTVLQIQDADISKFNVGDVVLVKETGAHHVSPIISKTTGAGTATITLLVAKPTGSFSNSVVVSKTQMFLTANSGHKSLSVSEYLGNEIVKKGIGCKVTGMSLEGFQTGGVPSLKFVLEGLSYSEADGAAPHTPSYDSGVPPIVLGANVYKDGVAMSLDEFKLSLSNKLSFIKEIGNAAGKSSSRVVSREISGSLNPYKDDTSVANFTNWSAGTEFSIFAVAYTPSSVSGEISLGSVVGIYLPKCIVTDYKDGNHEGISTDELGFQAVRGSDGSTEEMYLGVI
jgi:hypothetical protein